jgi:hypothetical protein
LAYGPTGAAAQHIGVAQGPIDFSCEPIVCWFAAFEGKRTMSATVYSWIAALIFAVIAILQLARAIMGVSITIGDLSVPLSVSWGAVAVAALLAWLGFRVSRA